MYPQLMHTGTGVGSRRTQERAWAGTGSDLGMQWGTSVGMGVGASTGTGIGAGYHAFFFKITHELKRAFSS